MNYFKEESFLNKFGKNYYLRGVMMPDAPGIFQLFDSFGAVTKEVFKLSKEKCKDLLSAIKKDD
jgi:hypothetical protein